MYSRLRYYSQLSSRNMLGSDALCRPPAHLLPPELFGLSTAGHGEQSDFATVGSIVTTMMGTTIVALPLGTSQAGLLGGVLCVAITGCIAYFTASLIVTHGSSYDDFSDFVRHYLGRGPQVIAQVASVLIILSALIIYDILMSQSLDKLVGGLAEATSGRDCWFLTNFWSQDVAALVVLLVFPLTNMKEFGVLVKVNSVGFLFLSYTVVFIVSHGVIAVTKGDVTVHHEPRASTSPPFSTSKPMFVDPWVLDGLGNLAAMLLLSFFIHCIVQPIMQRCPKDSRLKNLRRAYTIVGVLYLVIGVAGWYGFASAVEIGGNFLNLFPAEDVFCSSARLALFVQLFSVYPLLCAVIRTQVWGLVLDDPWPSVWHVLGLNVVVVAITTSFALWYSNVAEVIQFTGAIGGVILMFAAPIAIDIAIRRKRSTLTPAVVVGHSLLLAIGTAIVLLQFVPVK